MPKKVLVVEDDEKMRKMLVDAFDAAGFKTAQAGDGQEGLKLALEFKPDSIVTDLMMPVVDGLTMIRKLREDEWGKNVPVTVLTNSDQAGSVADALEKGVTKYMVKSDLSIEDIVNRIAKELE